MRKFLSLLAVLVCFIVSATAQNRTVTGQVKDAAGEPVPFASVIIKGTNKGTTTDANGNFKIEAGSADILVISGANFTPKELTVGTSSVLAVNLEASGNLQEVVVTALGVQKAPRELGYATTKVTNKEFTAAKAINVQNGLTGKVSGLNIATVNNGVFADTRITLRGIRSLTGNNQPLLVVDGIQINLAFLNSLNPNDIDDITILKGANAAALYGPDGVNGVILVKTKRGSKNGSPVINVGHTTQFESVVFLPDFQHQFGPGSAIDANGNGIYTEYENQQYGDEFDGSIRVVGRPLEDGSTQQYPYSYIKGEKEKFFTTGVTIQNDVSFGAKDFYISAQDVTINGTLRGDENRRTTFRFNAGKEYGNFKANFNLAYTQQNYNVASTSPYWEVFNTAGNIPLTSYSDWRNNPFASPNHYFNDYYDNPYYIKDRARSKGTNHNLIANIELNAKLLNWINVIYRLGTTVDASFFKNTSEAFTFSEYAKHSGKYNSVTDRRASVADGEGFGGRLISELFITGQKEVGSFSIDGLVGTTYRQSNSKSTNISGSNLIIPTLFNVANRTGELGGSESNSKSRSLGVFGKIAFGYKEWAFLEFTGRNDWDSRLPQNDRSFFYPGGSLSLVLSDAIDFLKNSETISYLKVRASVARSGNVNVGAYALEPIYNVAAGFPYGTLPGFTGSSGVNNPAIKPEFVLSKEAGFEISFLNNRITVEATAYLQDCSNQILNIGVSNATGYSTAYVNAADFDNKGLEFDLRLTPLFRVGALRFDFKGNFTLQDSKVTSVYKGLDEIGIANGNFAIVGYPAFMFKLTDYNRDDQGRVIVDRITGYPSLAASPALFGRTMPKYIIGLNPTVEFRGITLSITADYRGGHQVFHGIGSDMDFTGISARSAYNSRQRFVMPNSVYDDGTGKYVPNTDVLVLNGGYGFFEATATNRGVNSNYITSAAAWKVREISLSYELPKKLLARTRVIKGATIGFVGRNLFMFLPKSNQWTDPEFNNTTGNSLGVNNNSILPPNRLYGFNVNLTL
jgi:TonB-linked SusC/RagA family outer membrane protein